MFGPNAKPCGFLKPVSSETISEEREFRVSGFSNAREPPREGSPSHCPITHLLNNSQLGKPPLMDSFRTDGIRSLNEQKASATNVFEAILGCGFNPYTSSENSV